MKDYQICRTMASALIGSSFHNILIKDIEYEDLVSFLGEPTEPQKSNEASWFGKFFNREDGEHIFFAIYAYCDGDIKQETAWRIGAFNFLEAMKVKDLIEKKFQY